MNIILNNIAFDEGVISLTYMVMDEALRAGGLIWRTQTVSLAPNNSDLYGEAREILEAATSLLETLEQVYRNEAAYIPEEQEDEEEDDLDRGMGY